MREGVDLDERFQPIKLIDMFIFPERESAHNSKKQKCPYVAEASDVARIVTTKHEIL